jgi:hypothetical protein
MMRATMCLLSTALLALAACQASESRPRFVSEQHHFSIVDLEPDGWTHKPDRGAVVFAGNADDGLEQNTIAIRGIRREGDWIRERTAERVVPATRRVLSALPEAKVSPPTTETRGAFACATFDLTFAPRGKDRRYARRHVTCVGTETVFHLLHTSPEGELHFTERVFDDIVASLREEA